MTHSHDTNSGCFSGMLRRLLCTGNLPTHPSDGEFETPKTEAKLEIPPPVEEFRPGVVARLMGLNSLPDSNWVSNQRAPAAVSRSKSVNFADYLLEFDRSQPRHRRVRTSASFREVTPGPQPLLNSKNDLLVQYMKDFDDKKKESGLNTKKYEMGVGEIKQKKEKGRELMKKKENQRKKMKISKLKDEPRREIGKKISENRKCNGSKDLVSVLPSYKQSFVKNGGFENSKYSQKKRIIQKKESEGENLKKKTMKTKTKIKKKNVLEPDCDPENCSPISVLDFPDELNPLGMEMDSKQVQRVDDEMKQKVMKKKDNDSNERGEIDGFSEVVGRIWRLTEKDVREGSWLVKNVYEFEVFEELCLEIEQHVLNVLLVQTLGDLCIDL